MKRVVPAIAAALMVLAASGTAIATRQASPLHTNERYLGTVRNDVPVDTDDAMSVFTFVFGELDDEVTVLPTENYYYFSFFRDGVEWAGNIRLDVIDRDRGAVHFAYFERAMPWIGDGVTRYRLLAAGDGVRLVRTAPLVYEMTYRGRTVRFRLNDLAHVRPPARVIRKGESYLGPVFDESGIEFYLLFDEERKTFRYVLNESSPVADKLVPLAAAADIVVGRRSGFAFFHDARADRKILIGVYAASVADNSYFDGPFDQLPDNFVDRSAFRSALESAYPEVKGQIDDYGNFAGGDGRVLINPYRTYAQPSDLSVVSDCAAKAGDDDTYYRCLEPAE